MIFGTKGSRTQAKICGITRPEDARLAEEGGASYVGAVLVPGSPRYLDPEGARRVADAVAIPLVVVTANLTAVEAHAAAEAAGARGIQLHGDESGETIVALRELDAASGASPRELWKAVRVRGEGERDGQGEGRGDPGPVPAGQVGEAIRRWAPLVDVLLLDAWSPAALGGTGTSFPWEALEALDALRAQLPPGFRLGVAGGLGPGNVAEAIRRLRPDLVDVSSGVEASPGVKDPARIRAFLLAVDETQG